MLRRHDLWISDIPLRYPPYSAGAHRLFRNIIDTLNGISVPSTVRLHTATRHRHLHTCHRRLYEGFLEHTVSGGRPSFSRPD